jgi:hypothetical protein
MDDIYKTWGSGPRAAGIEDLLSKIIGGMRPRIMDYRDLDVSGLSYVQRQLREMGGFDEEVAAIEAEVEDIMDQDERDGLI